LADLASQFKVYPNQIFKWKKQVIENNPQLFNVFNKKSAKEAEEREVELYQQIGQLKLDLDWLKKNRPPSISIRQGLRELGEDLKKARFR
jgi:putative transposase